MTSRSRARRERANADAPASGTPPAPGERPPAPPRGPRARLRLRLPLLPTIAAAAGLVLLAAAWTTRLPPGPPREAEQAARFTVDIPADRLRVINSWERFFICYDLTDPAIVDLTLRANQRATGNLDFPGEKVIVELPSPVTAASPPPASAAEDELITAKNAVLGAALPERMASVRAQCGA